MIDQQVQRGKQWLEELLTLMGIPAEVNTGEIEIEELRNDPTCSWLFINDSNLTPEQIKILIGDRGEHIDAIQYLANTLLNVNVEDNLQGSFNIEINGYRSSRYKELYEIAQNVSQQVRDTGEEVALKSLSSAERRQIHTFLQEVEDLETESRGQEPDRRLVVKLRLQPDR
jgi:spoIIIJ-associated protein